MLTDEQIAEIRAKAEDKQTSQSGWTVGAFFWEKWIVKLCDHVDSLKSALEGVESVRQMQVRNIEDLTTERDELKFALRIMLASHSDWVHLNKDEKEHFVNHYKLHREETGDRISYSITREEQQES